MYSENCAPASHRQLSGGIRTHTPSSALLPVELQTCRILFNQHIQHNHLTLVCQYPSFLRECAQRDLNPHGYPPAPKAGASANSAISALIFIHVVPTIMTHLTGAFYVIHSKIYYEIVRYSSIDTTYHAFFCYSFFFRK